MPDENGAEATRLDAPSADDAPFGDAAAADDRPAAPVEGEDANGKDEQDPQGSDDAAAQDSGDAGEPADTAASKEDDLKVVVSIKGGRASIGVQQPSSDPHIETFEYRDLSDLAQEVLAVTERARARWEETPKYPAYERPAPPARRRNRRRQGAAQDATNAGTETEQAQQQTLALF